MKSPIFSWFNMVQASQSVQSHGFSDRRPLSAPGICGLDLQCRPARAPGATVFMMVKDGYLEMMGKQ